MYISKGAHTQIGAVQVRCCVLPLSAFLLYAVDVDFISTREEGGLLGLLVNGQYTYEYTPYERVYIRYMKITILPKHDFLVKFHRWQFSMKMQINISLHVKAIRVKGDFHPGRLA